MLQTWFIKSVCDFYCVVLLGDSCDNDDDNDGIKDNVDNCPKVFNPLQKDKNGGFLIQLKSVKMWFPLCISVDGTGDACENDFDVDGVVDAEDACPYNKEIKQANFNNYKTVKLSDNQPSKSEKHAEWKVIGNGSEITQLVDNFPEMLIGKIIYILMITSFTTKNRCSYRSG